MDDEESIFDNEDVVGFKNFDIKPEKIKFQKGVGVEKEVQNGK